jgi:hypothetical protein
VYAAVAVVLYILSPSSLIVFQRLGKLVFCTFGFLAIFVTPLLFRFFWGLVLVTCQFIFCRAASNRQSSRMPTHWVLLYIPDD